MSDVHDLNCVDDVASIHIRDTASLLPVVDLFPLATSSNSTCVADGFQGLRTFVPLPAFRGSRRRPPRVVSSHRRLSAAAQTDCSDEAQNVSCAGARFVPAAAKRDVREVPHRDFVERLVKIVVKRLHGQMSLVLRVQSMQHSKEVLRLRRRISQLEQSAHVELSGRVLPDASSRVLSSRSTAYSAAKAQQQVRSMTTRHTTLLDGIDTQVNALEHESEELLSTLQGVATGFESTVTACEPHVGADHIDTAEDTADGGDGDSLKIQIESLIGQCDSLLSSTVGAHCAEQVRLCPEGYTHQTSGESEIEDPSPFDASKPFGLGQRISSTLAGRQVESPCAVPPQPSAEGRRLSARHREVSAVGRAHSMIVSPSSRQSSCTMVPEPPSRQPSGIRHLVRASTSSVLRPSDAPHLQQRRRKSNHINKPALALHSSDASLNVHGEAECGDPDADEMDASYLLRQGFADVATQTVGTSKSEAVVDQEMQFDALRFEAFLQHRMPHRVPHFDVPSTTGVNGRSTAEFSPPLGTFLEEDQLDRKDTGRDTKTDSCPPDDGPQGRNKAPPHRCGRLSAEIIGAASESPLTGFTAAHASHIEEHLTLSIDTDQIGAGTQTPPTSSPKSLTERNRSLIPVRPHKQRGTPRSKAKQRMRRPTNVPQSPHQSKDASLLLQPEGASEPQMHHTAESLKLRLRAMHAAAANLFNFAEAFERLLVCRCCFHLISEPCVLWPCGHTFCRRCIEREMEVQGELIVCAQCRSPCWEGHTLNVVVDDMRQRWDTMCRTIEEPKVTMHELQNMLGHL